MSMRPGAGCPIVAANDSKNEPNEMPPLTTDLCQSMDVRREHKMSNDPLSHLQGVTTDIGPKPDQAVAASNGFLR